VLLLVRLLLVLLLLLILLLPRFVLVRLFYSHVMSNRAACDGAEHGMMMHIMSGDTADHCALDATGRMGGGDAAQGKTGANCRDHNMLHGERSQTSVEHLGRRETDFNRA
jgi:hypothetical protein